MSFDKGRLLRSSVWRSERIVLYKYRWHGLKLFRQCTFLFCNLQRAYLSRLTFESTRSYHIHWTVVNWFHYFLSALRVNVIADSIPCSIHRKLMWRYLESVTWICKICSMIIYLVKWDHHNRNAALSKRTAP